MTIEPGLPFIKKNAPTPRPSTTTAASAIINARLPPEGW
jgi:hypothetical protein